MNMYPTCHRLDALAFELSSNFSYSKLVLQSSCKPVVWQRRVNRDICTQKNTCENCFSICVVGRTPHKTWQNRLHTNKLYMWANFESQHFFKLHARRTAADDAPQHSDKGSYKRGWLTNGQAVRPVHTRRCRVSLLLTLLPCVLNVCLCKQVHIARTLQPTTSIAYPQTHTYPQTLHLIDVAFITS